MTTQAFDYTVLKPFATNARLYIATMAPKAIKLAFLIIYQRDRWLRYLVT